jgi:uncharacterized membrane protein YgcG
MSLRKLPQICVWLKSWLTPMCQTSLPSKPFRPRSVRVSTLRSPDRWDQACQMSILPPPKKRITLWRCWPTREDPHAPRISLAQLILSRTYSSSRALHSRPNPSGGGSSAGGTTSSSDTGGASSGGSGGDTEAARQVHRGGSHRYRGRRMG